MKDYYNSEWRNRSVMFLGGDVTESIIDDTIDVTARVRSDARDLQVTLGSAIEGERTLAPNLLWSMAVAVGAQFEVTGHLWLEEIVDQSKKKPIRWLLSEVSPANAPEIPVHFESRSAVGAHLIVADLADVGRTSAQTQWPIRTVHRIAFLEGTSSKGWPEARQVRAHLTDYIYDSPKGQPVSAHPATLTQAIVRCLRQVVHQHPGELVMLSGRMPKTVALAVGWHLAHPAPGQTCAASGCRQAACREPWAQLALLHYDLSAQRYALVRAHDRQPEDLLRRATDAD